LIMLLVVLAFLSQLCELCGKCMRVFSQNSTADIKEWSKVCVSTRKQLLVVGNVSAIARMRDEESRN
jgi:hypothetical protein